MGIGMVQLEELRLTPELVGHIADLEDFKGRWHALGTLAPDRLVRLRRVATIESVGSSTRIEGARLSDAEVDRLLSGLDVHSFRSRDEQEVAGYARVMELIFSSFNELTLTENHVKQLHGELLKFSTKDGRHRGAWKTLPNNVEAFDGQGRSLGVIFETASPFATPHEMTAPVREVTQALEARRHHPLLIIGCFVVRFLAIHPFQDGNGRLSRALTTLLLLRSGFGYVPYASLERVIEDNKDEYYRRLRAAQNDDARLGEWLEFFLRCLVQQKRSLAVKVDQERLLTTLTAARRSTRRAGQVSRSVLRRRSGEGHRRKPQHHQAAPAPIGPARPPATCRERTWGVLCRGVTVNDRRGVGVRALSANVSTSARRMALFIDFENLVTNTGITPQNFELKSSMDQLLEKGKVIFRRAYCNWTRFEEAKGTLHELGVELVDVPPSTRSGKNGADMRLVIDALELCYAREHIDTFVIASGDSDFCPLAYKLRENDRLVIGLAVREATSPLFVKACDEFIYLPTHTRRGSHEAKESKSNGHEPRRRSERSGGGAKPASRPKTSTVPAIAREVVSNLLSRATGPINPSLIKETIVRKQPDFDERDHGFSSLSRLLEAMEREGLLSRLVQGRQQYVVPPREGADAPAQVEAEERAAPMSAPLEPRHVEEEEEIDDPDDL